MDIDSILLPYQQFGVSLGLERMYNLLATLGNPHHAVPILHVAGTNGKGSVCAYLSSVLTAAGYRVGRYTSPHLIDWNERICLNEQPIASSDLVAVLQQVQGAINPNLESPTLFEVITAAAWLYFAEQKVDIAVIEVGLGGRLDATNVIERPLASIITSISREHWQILGSTLAAIATEKAGILKSGCPAIIGQLPPEALAAVQAKITELKCPAIFPDPAQEITIENAEFPGRWATYQGINYPLPLLGEFQLGNSALAIATFQILQQQRWQISPDAIAAGMARTKWLGRLQSISWRNASLLVDGAHNPASAQVLRQYVDTLQPSGVNWVMGMLSTKDHTEIFQALLKSGDRLYLVPVPDPLTANPEELSTLARQICPELTSCQTYTNLEDGLTAATQLSENLVVLCGSLYLIGYFLKTNPI